MGKLGLYDLHILILDVFKKIKEDKPVLENFLKLVYEEIDVFLKTNSIDKLPILLSQLAIKYSKDVIEMRLEEIHCLSEPITLDSKNLSAVKRSLVDVHFKDNIDEQIFKELMTNINKLKPIEFFSNDEEFAKKSKLGYANIAKNLLLDNSAFSFILI